MAIQMPESNENVYSFLQLSLRNQRDQVNALDVIISRMQEIENRVDEKVTKVEQIESNVSLLAKEIRDENRLMPSEIDDLFNAVVEKSIQIAKLNHPDEGEKFTKSVGKFRKLIWSKLKKHFGVSKYIHVKRVDYEPALAFIDGFTLEDYI